MSGYNGNSMQRAGLITLGLLGGGMTLGAASMEAAHDRDCKHMRDAGIPDVNGACATGSHGGSYFGGHGGGYHGVWNGTSYAEADGAAHGSVVRGGFGATGESLGGFHFGGFHFGG